MILGHLLRQRQSYIIPITSKIANYPPPALNQNCVHHPTLEHAALHYLTLNIVNPDQKTLQYY